MKLLFLIYIYIFILNECKSQNTGLRFSVACGRFQDNEKLFFGKCTLNGNSYARLFEFTDYVLKSDPNLDLDDFLRNYLTKNATQYFRKTYTNDSYIKKLDLFITELSSVTDKLKTSLSNVKVSEFFDAAKPSNFSKVLAEIIDERDKLQIIDWDQYQEKYCNQEIVSFCKSAKDLLDVNYVKELPESVLGLLEFIFERGYTLIDYLFLLPEKNFILQKLKKIDSQGTKGTLLSEVHEIMETRLFNYMLEFFNGSLPSFTTKISTTSTIKTTTTKKEKVLKIVAVEQSVYLSIPLTILFVTIVATIIMVVLKSYKKNLVKINNDNEIALPDIDRSTNF